MHAGKIESSERLQMTLAAIRPGWISTLGISRITDSMAVHSDIAALRCRGVNVESQCRTGRVWYYREAK